LSELMYRISVPISVFVMIFFAILLSKHNPRNKRNFGIGYTLITYIAYYNLMIYVYEISGELKEGIVLNFLLVHIIFAIYLSAILFYRKKY